MIRTPVGAAGGGAVSWPLASHAAVVEKVAVPHVHDPVP
jgi:hypothetical protein